MTKSVKIMIILIMACVVIVGGYFLRTEYRETKKMVDIVVHHELDASFYIRQFHKIEHAKNLSQLQRATEETLFSFHQVQTELNHLSLSSPQAIDVRREYEKGILSLQRQLERIKQSKNESDLVMLKKELAKSEQILLNAREKLFNLAERYNMTIRLKMGM